MAIPILAIVPGDPSGVGPEITARYLKEIIPPGGVRFAVLGAVEVLKAGAGIIGERLEIPSFRVIDEVPENVMVFQVCTEAPLREFVPGRMTVETGTYACNTLNSAIALAKAKKVQGIVTGPFNKEALVIGGIQAKNEFELLKQEFGEPDIHGEINILGNLWTTRVTSHIPIGDIPSFMKKDRILECIRFLHRQMQAGGTQNPKIAVAALNPHGGDGGMCGREEIDAIKPAVESAAGSGLNIVGPYPADTLFLRIEKEKIDGVLGMYHDQIQIPSKLLKFDQGVTLIGGLPIPYITCSHGTAYDIAGRGVAKTSAFAASVDVAVRMVLE